MCGSVFKTLIFIVFGQLFGLFLPKAIQAEILPKEVYLKEINERLAQLIKHSNEAQHFLEEDLSEASRVLSKANLQWIDSLESIPLLFENEGRPLIALSSSYSFMAQEKDQIKLVLKLLFHLQRQLDASTIPLPEVRIDVFAKKFSPILLSSQADCSFSLYPIPFPLTPSQREKFTTDLLSLMKSKGYHFKSKWSSKMMWLDSKSHTDTGCGGDNRNIQVIKAHFMEVHSKRSLKLAEQSSNSCGHKPVNNNRALKRIIKNIKTNLPKCNHAFWN